MTFWLKKGWLLYKPSKYGPHLNFIGSPDVPIEDTHHGGFRRISGFGSGWVDLIGVDYRPWRLTYEERHFEDTARLDRVA